VRRNYFYKPLSWREGEDNFGGTKWTVKNLFELKSARRVVIDGNVFENSWRESQDGWAILFTVRGEGNQIPWATIEDVEFTNNIVRHAASGFQIFGHDNRPGHISQQTRRITIRNNVFEDINSARWCGPNLVCGHFIFISDGTDAVTVDHNTIFQTGSVIEADGPAHTNFVFRNNIAPHNDYGVHGSGRAPGTDSLDHFFSPGYVFRRNLIAGATESFHPYPLDNSYPLASEFDAQFVDRAGGDYRLRSTSYGYQSGTDGKDVGVDVDELNLAVNGSSLLVENVVWTNIVNVNATGNSLTKNATTSLWDAGAVSTRTITSGDGYMEFSVGETNTHKMAGLSNGDTNQGYGDIDFALYPNDAGNIYIYEGGVMRQQNGNGGIFGVYNANTRLRVAVESGFVKYYKDGQLLYTSTGTPTYPLSVDTALWSPTIPGPPMIPGATINNVVIAGNFQALPTENVVWTNTVNVSVNGHSLTKSGTAYLWDAGAVSTKTIASGNGYVEFSVGETNKHRMCGLSNGDAHQSFEDIDFALYPNDAGNIYIYESGVMRQQNNNQGIFGTYNSTDRLRVSVEGGVIKYWKNTTLLYMSAVAPTFPLRVDTSLWSPTIPGSPVVPGATINNVVISGNFQQASLSTENVVWTNSFNVTANGNSLLRSASTSVWDGGASSTKALAYGDGYVEFTVGESGTNRMCGLSNGDTDQNYNDIDFALYPSANNLLYIYERGGSVYVSTEPYSPGDVFRVAVEGGVVKYRKNGALLPYTSPLSPTYPLRVDTSLYTPNSTINNVVISGFLTQ
jgi:hypothetical protein